MSKEYDDELVEIVMHFMNVCNKELGKDKITNDKDLDFYIKKGSCLNGLKDTYLDFKKNNKKLSKHDLRQYMNKIIIIMNDWKSILENKSITKGLQKCIPASSSYLIDINTIEILTGNNEWTKINTNKFKKSMSVEIDNGLSMENKSPTILIDTGGFGPSLITLNLFGKLDNKMNSYPTEITYNICGNTKTLDYYYILKWRQISNRDKVYEIKCGITQDIGIFKYGIFLANDFLENINHLILDKILNKI